MTREQMKQTLKAKLDYDLSTSTAVELVLNNALRRLPPEGYCEVDNLSMAATVLKELRDYISKW